MSAGYGQRLAIVANRHVATHHPGILAAMTSLALLAHAAHAAPPAFNSTFYATAATVIPVLFLAIAVQGRT
jgi:hypothetical protein